MNFSSNKSCRSCVYYGAPSEPPPNGHEYPEFGGICTNHTTRGCCPKHPKAFYPENSGGNIVVGPDFCCALYLAYDREFLRKRAAGKLTAEERNACGLS